MDGARSRREKAMNTLSSLLNFIGTKLSNERTIKVEVPSFSSLPTTVTDSRIKASDEVVASNLGTPSAQTSDWTVATSAGSLTISGSISGSTTATLYLTTPE